MVMTNMRCIPDLFAIEGIKLRKIYFILIGLKCLKIRGKFM